MRLYELMIVFNGELSKEDVAKEVEKFNEIVEKGKGKVLKVDEMGLRKLAYPIQKKTTGYYFVAYLEADPPLVNELKRVFKINENLFRFMFVKLDPKKVKITEE